MSQAARDLVSKILVVEPENRIKIDEILNHPWIANPGEDVPLPNVPGELSKYNARRRLRRAATAIMAMNRLKKMHTTKGETKN